MVGQAQLAIHGVDCPACAKLGAAFGAFPKDHSQVIADNQGLGSKS